MQGRGSVSELVATHHQVLDISDYLLHFLENHDEQRIASDEFAGDALNGRPAMLVSATVSRSPTLLYFGQDVGEDGMMDAGFGKATRTTIFDYWGVPAHQRFMNGGRFDGGQSTEEERQLRMFYEQLMTTAHTEPAFTGEYESLHADNLASSTSYSERQWAFIRWSEQQSALVVANFSDEAVSLELTANHPALLGGNAVLNDALFHGRTNVVINQEDGVISLRIPAQHGEILLFNRAH